MSLDYKLMGKGKPEITGGSVKKLFDQIALSGECTIDGQLRDIVNLSFLNVVGNREMAPQPGNRIVQKQNESHPAMIETGYLLPYP